MKVKELYKYLDSRIPKTLSCAWDNDGLMCCPEPEREVRRVLLCLDVSDGAVDKAVNGGFDVIVSHHPIIFKGLKSVSGETGAAGKLIKLIKSGISVMSFHTRFDALEGGVNDVLARILGLENVEKIENDGIELGRVGELSRDTELEKFASTVKEKLSAPFVSVGKCGDKVRRVAVVGGSGGDFVHSAVSKGADTLVSGVIGYHTMTEARDIGMNLIEAGHYYTENPSLSALSDIVLEADGSIYTEIIPSNTIFEI